jgi:hypothetical protein
MNLVEVFKSLLSKLSEEIRLFSRNAKLKFKITPEMSSDDRAQHKEEEIKINEIDE